jgi:hypothetical protein
VLLGARPQTPRVGFAELRVKPRLIWTGTNDFSTSFYGKEEYQRVSSDSGGLPQTSWVGFAEFWVIPRLLRQN